MKTNAPTRVDSNSVFLDLIRHNSFNSMNGEQIAHDLEINRGLWDSVLFCYLDSPGLTLRDMPSGRYNADTILLLTDQTRAEDLESLVRQWNCDSVTVLRADGAWVSHYCENGHYELRPISPSACDHNLKLSCFLGSSQPNDTRVVFQLWWD